MTQEEILFRLKEGNKRFVEDKNEGKLQDKDRRKELTTGQEPFAILLSCADSRVVPEMAFDTGLGEIFTVRVAGNVANSSSIASIEYAVANCGSKVIVVMGHESCGAVTAALQGGDNGKHINHLLDHIKPAMDKSDSEAEVNDVVKTNAKLTCEALMSESPIIKKAVDNNQVSLVPAYYNLGSGEVEFLN